jgi:transcription antitermination factor NusG
VAGPERCERDRFIIITADPRREAREDLFSRIRQFFGDVEIFAPVEKRMIRPRRKRSREPVYVQRPLFFQYVAIGWIDAWAHLKRLRGVWDLLSCPETQEPRVTTRKHLQGMLELEKTRSWDGQMIEILSGPFSGRTAIYQGGKIEVGLLGRSIMASVDPYHIRLVTS